MLFIVFEVYNLKSIIQITEITLMQYSNDEKRKNSKSAKNANDAKSILSFTKNADNHLIDYAKSKFSFEKFDYESFLLRNHLRVKRHCF